MKSYLILPILFPALALSQQICGSLVEGAKTAEEARSRAVASLAQTINSKVSSQSKMEEIIIGIESEQRDTTKTSIKAKLLNAQAAKYTDGKGKEGHSSQACMSYADAAKPYLDYSREQAGRLKNAVLALGGKSGKKEAWDNVVSIYKKLKDLEGVLGPLGQMDHALQKEYEADYSKAKKEYEAFAEQSGRGVYVESSDAGLKSKIASFLAKHGCALADEPESSALHLKLQVSEEQQTDPVMEGVVYCTPSVYVNLGDNKTGKGIFEDKIKVPKVGDFEIRKACEKALDKAAPDIWGAFQGKIQKEHCK